MLVVVSHEQARITRAERPGLLRTKGTFLRTVAGPSSLRHEVQQALQANPRRRNG